MTLEEFRDTKPTLTSHGRPCYNMTDKKWQDEFAIMKLYVTPVSDGTKRFGGKYSRESGREYENSTYDGITNWQSYCVYINDVLRNIRNGNHEFCYYAYQIMDLLKFHHDDLKTRYCDGYWEVWLEN